MKNIVKLGSLALLSLILMTACNSEQFGLGTLPTTDQLSFTATPSATKANIIVLSNTSAAKGIAYWNLGDGTKAKGDTLRSSYPLKGSYVITMTLYTSGGAVSTTKTVVIANDDMSLLNTPMFNALTGGLDSINGKTWVFDQYNNGHFGVGPFDANSPSWWSCPASGKDGSSLYTQEFTFTQIGTKLVWKNNGSVYTNQAGVTALAGLGYTTAVASPAGDFDVAYVPKASYKFSMNEAAQTLSISDGGFFGHYAGTSDYQIVQLTNNVLYLKCVSKVEPGNGWWYRFVPKALNVKPVIPLKAVPLSEDFESATAKVAFTFETMGPLTNRSYSNPAPLPINTSSKVLLYQKMSDFYANIYFKASGYKFDLSKQNKVTVKVFIPSYNDYVTTFPVAGTWITDNQLRPQLSVKLQNNNLGGNAYTTQTEIIQGNLATDKWLNLTFDFSNVATRIDYDKIVIQFGGEGHAAPGLFFLDDFSFSK